MAGSDLKPLVIGFSSFRLDMLRNQIHWNKKCLWSLNLFLDWISMFQRIVCIIN